MPSTVKKFLFLGALALLMALYIVLSPLTAHAFSTSTSSKLTVSSESSASSASSSSIALASWKGVTNGWANVRNGTTASAKVVTTYAPGTSVTVYAAVPGQVIWGGISSWYRVSQPSVSALYIYSGLVTADSSDNGGNPSSQGKQIVVSLSHQWLYAYENGKQVYDAAVMTGRPSLATPTGTYHVFQKLHPTTFYSPWPPGSPYYYDPTYINYALKFREGGFFLHDSWWHSVYGPGTNGWHYDPQFGWQWGTHGCVAMPIQTALWLYNWAGIGTTVQINA